MAVLGSLDGPHVSPRDGKEDFIAAEHVMPERALVDDAMLHDAGFDAGVPRWVWYAIATGVAVVVSVLLLVS